MHLLGLEWLGGGIALHREAGRVATGRAEAGRAATGTLGIVLKGDDKQLTGKPVMKRAMQIWTRCGHLVVHDRAEAAVGEGCPEVPSRVLVRTRSVAAQWPCSVGISFCCRPAPGRPW